MCMNSEGEAIIYAKPRCCQDQSKVPLSGSWSWGAALSTVTTIYTSTQITMGHFEQWLFLGLFTGLTPLTPAWLIMFRCTLGWAGQVAGTPGFISSRWKDILVFFVIRLTLTLMNQINLKTDNIYCLVWFCWRVGLYFFHGNWGRILPTLRYVESRRHNRYDFLISTPLSI